MSGAVGELLERCRAAGLLLTAEDEALHVPFEREPPGELIEELRQRKPEIMAALASATATTPPQLFESEPFYHEPCPTRRGLIRRSEGRFEHFCAVCGSWGSFGFDVTSAAPGRRFCFQHRP